MRLLDRLYDHSVRVRRHLGDRVQVGTRQYKVVGYLANVLSINDDSETDVAVVMRQLLRSPGAFIDVGANLGQTLGRVLSIDPDRRYLGFEPQVGACFYISRFLQDNDIANAQILPFGLGGSTGIRKFWSQGDGDVMGSMVAHRLGTRETLVPVRRGDDVLAEIGIETIAAIKIDVEGAELEVMQGLDRTLRQIRPPILFEVLPNFEGHDRRRLQPEVAKRQSENATEIWRFLTDLNYRIYQIDPRGAEIAIPRFDLDNISGFVGFNYIARPQAAS